MDSVSLRYSNVFGPRQRSDGEGGVVAIFIDKILEGKRPAIFGAGLQTRDFLYVDDAVDAAVSAIKASSGTRAQRRVKKRFISSTAIYNVGTNKEINIKELLVLISLEMNQKVKPKFLPLRQGEILKSRVDYSKIKKDLGWQPKYSLEDGLKKTIKWFKIKK